MNIIAIAQNDLAVYTKRRGPIFWTFVGPGVCMWLFGFLTPGASNVAPVTIVDYDKGIAAKALVEGLRNDGHSIVEVETAPHNGLWLSIPAGFSRGGVPVTMHADSSETNAERSLYYELEAQLSAHTGATPAQKSAAFAKGFQRTVPAYLIMFLTMNLMVSGASFAEERHSGRLRRLLTAPVSNFDIIAGRLGSRLVIAWLQMAVLFAIGVFVLHINWAQHPVGLVFILSLYALAIGAVGIFFGTLFQDPDQAQAVAMWVAILMAPLTGLWWPVELMPKPFVALSHYLPTGSIMRCVNSMLATGSGLEQFPYTIAGLGILAVATMWLASRRLAAER